MCMYELLIIGMAFVMRYEWVHYYNEGPSGEEG